jgi:hypothetical protein
MQNLKRMISQIEPSFNDDQEVTIKTLNLEKGNQELTSHMHNNQVEQNVLLKSKIEEIENLKLHFQVQLGNQSQKYQKILQSKQDENTLLKNQNEFICNQNNSLNDQINKISKENEDHIHQILIMSHKFQESQTKIQHFQIKSDYFHEKRETWKI